MAAASMNAMLLKHTNSEVSSTRDIKVPTSIILLQMCHHFQEVKQLHAQLIVSGLLDHPRNPGRLVQSYVSTSQFCYALSVFETIPLPDVFAYNNMIRGLMLGEFPNGSLLLYHQLLLKGMKPDNHTYTFVIKTCSRLKALSEGKQVHCQIIKAGTKPESHIQSSLIHMYSNCNCMESAEQVLAETSEENILAMNSMITGYVNYGQTEIAREMFDKMSEKDTATWSTMITGYTKSNMHAEALSIFQDMTVSRVPLNESTLVSGLSACAHLGALDLGRWIHKYIHKNCVRIGANLGTALIDMYAKCGCIDSSYQVFKSMSKKDIVTWGVTISGFSMHGKAQKCFELFDQMVNSGIKPNEVIFVSILSACSHAGFVELGFHYFNQMVHRFEIRPSIEHYGCMVDLLGRAGRLAEAEELISSMTEISNSVIWGGLLSGCIIHKDLKRGERAFKQLVKLEPMSVDRYKMAAKFFAAMGAKENAEKAWIFVKYKSMDATSGLSLVEIDGIVHKFVVGDINHSRYADIIKMFNGAQ